jgi:hypothetical protein
MRFPQKEKVLIFTSDQGDTLYTTAITQSTTESYPQYDCI